VYALGMATRNAGQLCNNRTKAEYRMWVLKAFHIWLRGMVHLTVTRSGRNCIIDPATIYSLPATLWEFEQFVAGESLLREIFQTTKQTLMDLHCFEREWPVYAAQKDSRSFLLNDKTLYKNFHVDYSHGDIPVNCHAKNNFGAWYDFCGNPIEKHLDVAIARQNFKHNSLVFVTFDCNVQAGIKVLPVEIQGFIAERMDAEGGKMCDYITDATVEYINNHTGNKVKCIMSVEYQAQLHPMMLLGFTNSQEVLEYCPPVHERIERYTAPIGKKSSTPMTQEDKADLKVSLRSGAFTQTQLRERYNCTNSQIGAIIAHHGGSYRWA
jgi:hypothetical protein